MIFYAAIVVALWLVLFCWCAGATARRWDVPAAVVLGLREPNDAEAGEER